MTDGLLENIIRLEKQLQAEVAEEEIRAQRWQENELEQLVKNLNDARTRQEGRYQKALAEQKSTLLSEVRRIEEATQTWCERLADLGEASLRKALERQLASILPGGDDDHPNGQS